MRQKYSAIEVTRPGVFSEVSKPMPDPGPDQVRIHVQACGVCHSDFQCSGKTSVGDWAIKGDWNGNYI